MFPTFDRCTRLLVLSSLLLLSGFLTGCSAVQLTGGLPAEGTATDVASPPTPQCFVELRNGQDTEVIEVPLDGETRVQDALDAARATSEFRNLEVVLLRRTENSSEPILKLACRFDRRSRQIGWESDYAVLPGDRIMVREDRSSRFDQVVGSLLGPVFGSRK